MHCRPGRLSFRGAQAQSIFVLLPSRERRTTKTHLPGVWIAVLDFSAFSRVRGLVPSGSRSIVADSIASACPVRALR